MKRICKKCDVEKDIIQFDFLQKHKKIDKNRMWTCVDCLNIEPCFENLDGEVWKDIENTKGKYQVSSFRRFRSFCISGSKKTTDVPVLIKKRISKTGYWVVDIHIDYKKFSKKAHILFAQAFIENPNNLPELNHKNGNRLDDSKENLEWCTHAENMRHAFRLGLIPIGEDRINRKLTKEKAMAIFTSTEPTATIAKQYNVTKGHVRDIKLKILWRSLHKSKEELYQEA